MIQEILCLFKLYWRQVGGRKEHFDRRNFRDFLFECFDMNEELFLDRIFHMFNPDMDTNITR